MAIYRFRVSFEDYDDVIREVDIRSNQTFEELHLAIHQGTGYDPEHSSSFYVSNDQWIKGEEIGYLPSERKIDRGIALMSNSKLSSFIDDPHQKFYYIYNFDRPFDFHVELIRIMDEEKGKEYPLISKSIGEAPRPFGQVPLNTGLGDEEDIDLDEEDEADDETHEMESVEDLTITDHPDDVNDEEENDEEKDEFLDEFSDDEQYDPDDY